MSLISKLPNSGTTIFSVMTRLAIANNAVNLAQGFPDFDTDPVLIAYVNEAMQQGHNQYAPMPGVPELCHAISKQTTHDFGYTPDPETEVTITAGGTQALFSIIGAIIGPGDNVIVLEPCYDSYIPSVQAFGGTVTPIPLEVPDFRVDWSRVENAITTTTKAIIINSPQNPSGSILLDSDMMKLQEIAAKHDLYVISDEVYAHIIFDGERHESVIRYPDLYKRSFAVFSFGKSLHVTGWKTGYVVAPAELTSEFRKIHQFNVFSGNRPVQWAIARYLEKDVDLSHLAGFYEAKRDFFMDTMKELPLDFLPCRGSYFAIARYDGLSEMNDLEYAKFLTQKAGVATIPLSPFYKEGSDEKIVRFCFAKKEETILEAANRLKAFFQKNV